MGAARQGGAAREFCPLHRGVAATQETGFVMNRTQLFTVAASLVLAAGCNQGPIAPNAEVLALGNRSLTLLDGQEIPDIQTHLDRLTFAVAEQGTEVRDLDGDGTTDTLSDLTLFVTSAQPCQSPEGETSLGILTVLRFEFGTADGGFKAGDLLNDNDDALANGAPDTDGLMTSNTLHVFDKENPSIDFIAIMESTKDLAIDANDENGLSGRLRTSVIALLDEQGEKVVLENPVPVSIEFGQAKACN
jgi:hypothetical protein